MQRVSKTPWALLGLGAVVCAAVAIVALSGLLAPDTHNQGFTESPFPAPPQAVTFEPPAPNRWQFLEPIPDAPVASEGPGPRLLGNVAMVEGAAALRLSDDQVAIGAAEAFQDVMDVSDPPLTIFVVYGAADTAVTLRNGGWDLWENATEPFIQDEISENIGEVSEAFPDAYAARGYRVIRCYSQVSQCIESE